ncbi:hypothetical protein SAMN05660350_01783 [Geodermatophilus obscurus]|uniref:DUF4352 domain-containing protein n=1 Tax=Geodermatophilus obscurus TaxID=1861 RepID=A0A1M7TJC1_9ACTN|nr:hypothetical protein [Geodermatophilus obscurus]SHN70786.1 hypothetical protein SAMN05660350_01783 [Geodermatophilus obscurus]
MTTGTPGRTPREARHRRLLAAGAVTLGAAALLAVALVAGRGGTEPAGSGPPAAIASPEATGTAEPTATAGPSASVPPAPAPTGDPAVLTGDPAELPPGLPAVALDGTAAVGDGVTGTVESLEATEGTATGPGNVAGPAVRVTVRLANGTAEPVSFDGAVVTLAHGAEQVPASPLDDPSARPFSGVVDPGDSAVGVYVFTVGQDARGAVTVSVGYRPGAPYLVFTGAAD